MRTFRLARALLLGAGLQLLRVLQVILQAQAAAFRVLSAHDAVLHLHRSLPQLATQLLQHKTCDCD